jgi:hypothetical protein
MFVVMVAYGRKELFLEELVMERGEVDITSQACFRKRKTKYWVAM